MSSRVLLTGVLLLAAVSGVCLAETVNINPHKIVLNAEGKADDVQANVHIVLASALIVDFDVILSFDGTEVAKAESARYCLIGDILIIDFDRAELQAALAAALDDLELTNVTATATVVGSVTVINADGDEIERSFSGSDDMVEIVAPGKKK